MNFEDAFAQLNEEQKAAVSHIEGPLMVLAGPGTGKTQILALRIAKILKETQVEPYNILCLTFTESGVAAMRRRLLEFIGPAAYSVRVCTFHAFCNDIIKEYPEKFLFARELEPLTEIERIQLFRALLDELPDGSPLKPFADPYFYQRDLIKTVQDLKRENLSPEALDDVLRGIETVLKTHRDELEEFVAIHGGSLKAEDLFAMKGKLEGTFLASAFLDLDLEDKKARTQAKNKLKAAYEEANAQLPKQKAMVEFFSAYQKTLKQRGRYDYEDMILFTLNQLKHDAELLARLQEQYQYILVDEYQDTNGAQNEVVKLLGSYYENPNIFVVGDDKQSIYRFQGASLENMLEFYRTYKASIELVTLQKNYRSQQTILDAATSLIGHNEQGLENLIPELKQKLTATTPHTPQKVRVAELPNSGEERYFLAEQIQNLLDQGADPSGIAIFFRNNRDSEALVELFLRLKIPFHLYSGKNVLEDKEIQKIILLLEWLSDTTQDRNLFFVLNLDFLELDSLEILKLTRQAAEQRIGLWEALEKGSSSLQNFRKKIGDWISASINKTFIEFFEGLLNDSGFLTHILKKPDHLESLHRLNTFFDQVKQWNRSNPSLHLKEFIDYLKLLQENQITLPESELSTQKKAVALMTAHRSKGLEFEHVFVMQCTDKHWGNNPSRAKIKLPSGLLKTLDTLNKERNEDERRLFYVALTRAKKSVTLTYSKTNENGREEVPSLFLAELDSTTLQKIDSSVLVSTAEERLEANFYPLLKPVSQEEESFVKSLVLNYTLSVTHLNNYLTCPRLFYYENLLRVPRAKTRNEAFGTAIHESLKDLLLDLQKSTTLDPKRCEDLLLDSFERHLKREILVDRDHRGILHFGQETLQNYFGHYKDQLSTNVLLEYNFAPHHVHVDEVPITGKLDKIQILESAGESSKLPIHVVDYKTGNPDTKSAELGPDGSYRRQIIFYQLLCDYSTNFPYQMVSGEIDFIQMSKKENDFVKRRFQVTEEEKQNLKATIKDVYADIQNLKFLQPDEWTTCGECDYCLLFS